MTLAGGLPAWNAALNATSGILLVLGRRAIRAGDRARHRRLMIAAVAVSALFLVSYLARVALTGLHRFPIGGPVRALYLALLGSHTLLAALAAPLALWTLALALRERIAAHRRLARVTYPVWLYVSVTGVLVYLMLYQVAPRLA